MKISVRTEVTTTVTIDGATRVFHDTVEWHPDEGKWDALASWTRLIRNAYDFVQHFARERGVTV